MRSWAVSLESGVIIEADEVEEHEDGRLVFYREGFPPIEFPPGAVIDYQEIDD